MSDTESSSSSVGDLINPAADAQLLRTIASLRNRDASVFRPEVRFFGDSASLPAVPREIEQRLLETANPRSAPDGGAAGPPATPLAATGTGTGTTRMKTAREREDEARAGFASKAEQFLEEGSDSDGLLRRKGRGDARPPAPLDEAINSYKSWLREQLPPTKDAPLITQDPLSEVTNPDEFLTSYIANQAWLGARRDGRDGVSDASSASESDRVLNVQELYEDAYNHQHSEPEMKSLITYARNLHRSAREKVSRRKRARARRAEQQEERARADHTRLAQARAQKRQEFAGRIRELSEASGIPLQRLKTHHIFQELDDSDFDGEVDMDRVNRDLDEVFGDAYYEHEDAGTDAGTGTGTGTDTDTDGSRARESPASPKSHGGFSDGNGGHEHEHEDEDDSGSSASHRGGRGAVQKAPGAPAGEQPEKPLDAHTAVELDRMLAELNMLEEPDTIPGVGPCRFKYVAVEPDDYGLSPEDLLNLPEKELDRIISVRSMAPYSDRPARVNTREYWRMRNENLIAGNLKSYNRMRASEARRQAQQDGPADGGERHSHRSWRSLSGREKTDVIHHKLQTGQVDKETLRRGRKERKAQQKVVGDADRLAAYFKK